MVSGWHTNVGLKQAVLWFVTAAAFSASKLQQIPELLPKHICEILAHFKDLSICSRYFKSQYLSCFRRYIRTLVVFFLLHHCILLNSKAIAMAFEFSRSWSTLSFVVQYNECYQIFGQFYSMGKLPNVFQWLLYKI